MGLDGSAEDGVGGEGEGRCCAAEGREVQAEAEEWVGWHLGEVWSLPGAQVEVVGVGLLVMSWEKVRVEERMEGMEGMEV